MIKGLLFDVDDTLYDLAEPFRKACREVFPDENLDVDGIFRASRRYSDEVFELSQSGAMSMDQMYIYRIQHAFADFNKVIDDKTSLEFQTHYRINQKKISLSGTMIKILNEWKDRIILGIITNGPSDHQWNKINTLQLMNWIPKENIFVSADVGIAKPDAGIFRLAAEHLETAPDQLCFVGDSFLNDIVGAHNAGYHTVWFNRRRAVEEGEVKADREVSTEEELLYMLSDYLGKGE